MPRGVTSAGGPGSTRRLSNRPRRVRTATSKDRVGFLASRSSRSTGVQSTRLSDVAAKTSESPQYIQYFPPIRTATTRLSPSRAATMAPDRDQRSAKRPPSALPKASPCFVQWTRSREVATASRGFVPSKAV